jgi:hypothetical protein
MSSAVPVSQMLAGAGIHRERLDQKMYDTYYGNDCFPPSRAR